MESHQLLQAVEGYIYPNEVELQWSVIIFGSVKANPWWSTPLMPIVFPRGQLFSKSFLGYTSYKMAFATREGLLPSLALLVLPLLILWGLVSLLPPWPKEAEGATPPAS